MTSTHGPDSAGPSRPPGDVTRILRDVAAGDEKAQDQLLPLVYDELRRVARRQLRRERADPMLQTTALVHDAYLKLVQGADPDYASRAHFYALAARAMRQVLIDAARRRTSAKRGGDWVRTTLGDRSPGAPLAAEELLALDEALTRLGELDARLQRVVECRYFGGLSDSEIAQALGVTKRTVQRDWTKARAWLYKELYPRE